MNEYFYLIAGFLILAVTFFDFFYTTLSSNGTSFLSKACYQTTNSLMLVLEKKLGRNVFRLSGMMVNIVLLLLWILLIWIGLFLVYTYNVEGIVDDKNRVASTVERLYFTGYVLSTLGLGNIRPNTPFFEIVTSLFSFFGFVFFTTTMTYLLSVASAVIQKRNLAFSIHLLGKNPIDIVKSFERFDVSFSLQQIAGFQQMINKLSSHYHSYPVLHFYHHPDDAYTLSIKIAVLDESLSIMLDNNKFNDMKEELKILRRAIDYFFKHLTSRYNAKGDDFPNLNNTVENIAPGLVKEGFWNKPELVHRRKVLTSLLQNENRNWNDVYVDLNNF